MAEAKIRRGSGRDAGSILQLDELEAPIWDQFKDAFKPSPACHFKVRGSQRRMGPSDGIATLQRVQRLPASRSGQ